MVYVMQAWDPCFDHAGLLLSIHEEVVSSVSQRLPPEMQVLNSALQARSRCVVYVRLVRLWVA